MTDESKTWTTREGVTLPIRQMSTTHLLATIHFIERKRMETLIGLGGIDLSAGVDAEVLTYYAQWPDAYEALLDEAERRQVVRRGTRRPREYDPERTKIKGGRS